MNHLILIHLNESPIFLVAVYARRQRVQLFQVLGSVVEGARVDVPGPPRVGVGCVVLGDELFEVATYSEDLLCLISDCTGFHGKLGVWRQCKRN